MKKIVEFVKTLNNKETFACCITIFLLILSCIGFFGMIKSCNSNQNIQLANKLQVLNENHKIKVQTIIDAKNEEVRQLAENQKQLTRRLQELSDKHTQDTKKLIQQTNAQVENNVKKFENKPNDLALELNKKFGFEIEETK